MFVITIKVILSVYIIADYIEVTAFVLEYRDKNREKWAQCTEETTNVCLKIEDAVDRTYVI